MKKKTHPVIFFQHAKKICEEIDFAKIDKMANLIKKSRDNNGRIFFLGVGGSAGNCSHAVNDFRKLCNIEAYTPTDNVSELTARINDEGWDSSFVGWLKISKLNKKDLIFIFSVGGGNLKKKVSVNLVKAVQFSKKRGAKILGIVGKKDGYASKKANLSIFIPSDNKKLVTPLAESFQAVVWHCLVSHPVLQKNKTKW